MSDVDKKDIRIVGYGVLGSAIVFLIYDIVPLMMPTGIFPDVVLKMIAFSCAIVVGALSLKLFPKIKQLQNRHFIILVGTLCTIIIGGSVLWILIYHQTFPQTVDVIPSHYGFIHSNMWIEVITPLITLGMLLVLIWQTRILSKQSRLASGPSIFPRFVFNDIDNKIHIHLFNVGKGNAVDVHLQFKDTDGKLIGRQKIDAYALLTVETEVYNQKLDKSFPEYIDTGISFDVKDKVKFKIEGWYRDTNGDKIDATREYEYPPKLIE